jgi:hypothetical protein
MRLKKGSTCYVAGKRLDQATAKYEKVIDDVSSLRWLNLDPGTRIFKANPFVTQQLKRVFHNHCSTASVFFFNIPRWDSVSK